jgi:hypothetical protein
MYLLHLYVYRARGVDPRAHRNIKNNLALEASKGGATGAMGLPVPYQMAEVCMFIHMFMCICLYMYI